MIETTLTGNTPDIAEENIQKLRQIFPDVFTEDKVDFEKLQQVLGEYVEDSNERYNFTWNGKGRALRLSQTPSLGTLRPCKEESKDWDTTQNLYIEGDNLEVLKLLQKSYYGKVKMIYIDPPYNTGKDFVYKDDFHDSLENYKRVTGQVDGNGKAISTNTEASGRYHTDWLNMMYPRLRLARNLLTDDGVLLDTAAEDVHNGYFSADKKGVFKDTSGSTLADEDAYNLIMKDKERLLSFDTKLRFIFSHSALREGWDNPNVFQICTLNETRSEVKKRQEIGRGLRLCVNQDGERQHGFSINTLTVMANESYEDFADALQKEYETESGIRFGIVETHLFANIPVKQEDGSVKYLGQEASETIFKEFLDNGYIDEAGKVQDKLKIAIKDNKLNVPEEFEHVKAEIKALARKVCSSLNIKNNSDKKTIKLNKQVYLDPEFKDLWDRIKYKTTYSVDFDSEKLIDECCKEMQNSLSVSSAKLIYTKAGLDISAGGVVAEESDRYSVGLNNLQENIPDIIAYLQNETNLTRKTIVEILLRSKTIHLFKKNPQRYMEQVVQIISAKMRHMIVDGIKYTKIGDGEYYAQELFETEELTGYLSKNMIESKKSVYEYVVYDSANEESFATSFENNKNIKLYAKLPNWFTIATPLGTYNPDWVVLIEVDGKDKLYFVLETKADTMFDALRPTESAKIKCGRKHFEALGNDVAFDDIDSFEEFIEEQVVV